MLLAELDFLVPGGKVELAVILLSMVLIQIAVVLHWRASRIGPFPEKRMHLFISVLAMLYLLGYLWLIFLRPDHDDWGAVMRGFSLVAWVNVWILPPFFQLKRWKDLEVAVEKRIEEET